MLQFTAISEKSQKTRRSYLVPNSVACRQQVWLFGARLIIG